MSWTGEADAGQAPVANDCVITYAHRPFVPRPIGWAS